MTASTSAAALARRSPDACAIATPRRRLFRRRDSGPRGPWGTPANDCPTAQPAKRRCRPASPDRDHRHAARARSSSRSSPTCRRSPSATSWRSRMRVLRRHRVPSAVPPPAGTAVRHPGRRPPGTGSGGPGYAIQDEPVTATYHRGDGRDGQTSRPDSAASQFFIVLDDNRAHRCRRPPRTRSSATVTSGMDTVDAIRGRGGWRTPADPVPMTTVTVTNP